MLEGRGTVRNIVCPIHRWTYALDGKLLGAPHFARTRAWTCTRARSLLERPAVRRDARRRSRSRQHRMLPRSSISAGYVFDRVHVARIRLQLEDVYRGLPRGLSRRAVPPGTRQLRRLSRICAGSSATGTRVQTCGVRNRLAKAGKRGLPALARGGPPLRSRQPARAWRDMAYILPNIMVEWYPHVARRQHAVAARSTKHATNVVEFYYPEEIGLFEREFVEAEQAAYRETAIEDAEIIARITAGRRVLVQQALDQRGPYQSPLEDGMQHFHEFIRRELSPHVHDARHGR